MPKYRTLDYIGDRGIARIAFNRPPANAINGQMAQEMFEIVNSSEQDSQVKVRYITGSGKYFNLGLDLKAVDLKRTSEIDFWIHEYLNPAICILIQSPKLTISAVNGPAVGAGASFALAADLIYMSSTAYFSFPFVKMGLIPDLLAGYTLQRAIGYKRASRILLQGEDITAAQAESLGLVNTVYDSAILEQRAYAEALKIARFDPAALAATKEILGKDADLASRCKLEEALQSKLLKGTAFQRAVNTFRKE